MSHKLPLLLGVAMLTALAFAAIADSESRPSVSTPVTKLKYGPTGVSDGVHG